MQPKLRALITAFATAAADSIATNEQPPDWGFGSHEPVLASVPWSYMPSQYDQANFESTVTALGADPDLAEFSETCAKAGSNLRGVKNWKEGDFLAGMVSSARRRIYFEGQSLSGAKLADYVIENYANLELAAQKQPVRTTTVLGLSGVSLAPGEIIVTPWGSIRGELPKANGRGGSDRPTASAVLVAQHETTTVYGAQKPVDGLDTIRNLLPLAFALESAPGDRRCPIVTFLVFLHPWQTGNSTGIVPPPPSAPWAFQVTSSIARAIENRLVALSSHNDTHLLIAARRTVQALSERGNDADRLIDAVTAWESLVGHRSETTFFVSFALTRLLETPGVTRMAQMRELKDIYNARSYIVHGAPADRRKLATQANRAVEIALLALDRLYQRDESWLSMNSEERATRLILDEDPE